MNDEKKKQIEGEFNGEQETHTHSNSNSLPENRGKKLNVRK